MKNLKKVLALVMTFAMAFTMFTGATFTDQADIKQTEAVDTLVALGVIAGNPDGSFKPEGNVTRAEMAKMIYVLRTGKSDATAYASATSTFKDINGHWAAGYIKYCQALGIIAGKSATQFDPEGAVTGNEAAKMLLVTLGYDATKAGLVGHTWDKTTIALADENGLLNDVTAPMSMALPRQYAAQLMFNAVDAATVKLTDGAYSNMNIIGGKYPTVGEKYMGLKKTIATLDSVTKTDGKSTYELSLSNPTDDSTGEKAKAVTNFKNVAKDYSAMKFQQVKVLYKDKDNVYGVYATVDNIASSTVLAKVKMDGAKIKVDGAKSDIDVASAVYVDGAKLYMKPVVATAADFSFTKDATFTADATIAKFVTVFAEGTNVAKIGDKQFLQGTNVQVLSTNGNTKMDTLNVMTVSAAKVSYVGTDYINAGKVYKDGDYNYSKEIKKDEYVVITLGGNYSDGKGVITKADIVEGKVTATKSTNKVMINGTWYNTVAGLTAPTMGANAKLVLAGGYVYMVDTITAGTSDVALLVQAGVKSAVGANKAEARVIFADGTDKVVSCEKDINVPGAAKETIGDVKAYEQLVTFDVSKDVYTFTKVNETGKAGYNGYKTATADVNVDGSVTGTGLASKVYFSGDAVVFVQYKTDSYKVVTGKDVANWKAVKGASSFAALTSNKSGNDYAQVAFLKMTGKPIPGGSTKTYAVALDSSYTEKVDGTTYTMIKAWNGTEEVTYKIDGIKTLVKGDSFEYSLDSNSIADITKVVTSGNDTKYITTKVNAYDAGTGEIVFSDAAVSTKSKITKDTKILYIDSDANKGVGNGEIQLAADVNGNGEVEKNVIVYSENGNDYITLIIVDVQNNMKYTKA